MSEGNVHYVETTRSGPIKVKRLGFIGRPDSEVVLLSGYYFGQQWCLTLTPDEVEQLRMTVLLADTDWSEHRSAKKRRIEREVSAFAAELENDDGD